MDQPAIDAIHRVIRQRRTVKPAKMTDRTIERNILDAILENANWAPTHGRTEPWRFQVYGGEARRRLGEILLALYDAGLPPEKRKPEKREQLPLNPLRASHVIVVWMKRSENEKIPEVEEIEAVACAVQNMQLTARAYGIASFWSTGNQTYSSAAPKLFGIVPPDRYLGVLYLGYPAQGFPAGTRLPLADKVTWHLGRSSSARSGFA